MTTAFAPTTKRGVDLAEEILATIEYEDERRQAALKHLADYEDRYQAENFFKKFKTNAWSQGTWGTVFADALPAGTSVEIANPHEGVFSRSNVSLDFDEGDLMAIFNPGVSCGTAMCFAGHATFSVGDRFVTALWDVPFKPGDVRNAKRVLRKMDRPQKDVENVVTTEGKLESVHTRAQELLELSSDEAGVLFSAVNSLDDLRAYVAKLREGYDISTGCKTTRTKRRAGLTV